MKKVFRDADNVNQVRFQILRGEIEAMEMKESDGVSDTVQSMVNQLKHNGENLLEKRVAEKNLTDPYSEIQKCCFFH